MRIEYDERVRQKGIGRNFHSLRAKGGEIAYVQELADFVNAGAVETGRQPMQAHAQYWLEAYARRTLRMEAVFAQTREPAVNDRIIDLVSGC